MRHGLNEIRSKTESSLVHFTYQSVKPFKVPHATVTVHDLIPAESPDDVAPSVLKFLLKNLEFYKRLPYVCSDSNHTRDVMEQHGFEGKIEVVHLGVSNEFKPSKASKKTLRTELGLPLDKKLVLSVSANYGRKNLKVVKEAVDKLGSDYRLVRVGSPLGESITFRGIDVETLSKIYNACDALLFPSLSEGFGYPLVEAFRSGTPVVASDIEVFREVAKDGAVLVEPDAVSCAAGVREAIDRREELSSKGLAIGEEYSLDAFSKRLRAFYRNAMKEHGI